MPRPLTDKERQTFHDITTCENIGVVQTSFDGEDTAVIAAFNHCPDGTITVEPLAVLVTDAIMAKLSDPTE